MNVNNIVTNSNPKTTMFFRQFDILETSSKLSRVRPNFAHERFDNSRLNDWFLPNSTASWTQPVSFPQAPQTFRSCFARNRKEQNNWSSIADYPAPLTLVPSTVSNSHSSCSSTTPCTTPLEHSLLISGDIFRWYKLDSWISHPCLYWRCMYQQRPTSHPELWSA